MESVTPSISSSFGPSFGPAESIALGSIVDTALAEDLSGGDMTSRHSVPPGLRYVARIVSREDLVFSGGRVASAVFSRLGEVSIRNLVEDGSRLGAGTVACEFEGDASALLAGERTVLNLMQRMTGVATATRRYVDAAGKMHVVDTRKTMPGLRCLDRYAVRCGGGRNHRNDLGSGVLIKENHIRCAGGVKEAICSIRDRAPHGLKIECEIQTHAELQEAIDADIDIVLLDNMDDSQVRTALDMVEGTRVLVEVSGGITLERIPRLAKLGVPLVSIGALTHSVRAADLSMLFDGESLV